MPKSWQPLLKQNWDKGPNRQALATREADLKDVCKNVIISLKIQRKETCRYYGQVFSFIKIEIPDLLEIKFVFKSLF